MDNSKKVLFGGFGQNKPFLLQKELIWSYLNCEQRWEEVSTHGLYMCALQTHILTHALLFPYWEHLDLNRLRFVAKKVVLLKSLQLPSMGKTDRSTGTLLTSPPSLFCRQGISQLLEQFYKFSAECLSLNITVLKQEKEEATTSLALLLWPFETCLFCQCSFLCSVF